MQRVRVAIVLAALVGGVGVAHGLGTSGATVDTPARRLAVPSLSFSVVAVGDWLSEQRINLAAAESAPDGVRFDHRSLVAPIAPIIASADLAICHMETPIGEPGAAVGLVGRSPAGYSLIAAPHELAGDLRRVGFDRCSTASNHSWDLGAAGIASTLAALDGAGISHSGTARSPAESVTSVFDVDGTPVAHLSFALNSNTGFPPESWRINRVVDSGSVIAAVDDARRRGAEIVIVSLHVFVEMQSTPAPADRTLVDAITRFADVDLVVIHGPHSIQPLEHVNGTPVFWSLGNFVSGMGVPRRGRYSDPRSLDGLLASVRFTERIDGSFAVLAEPVLLCEMADSRIVYPGFAPSAVPVPADAAPGIEACRRRSVAVVSGLR